MTTYLDPLEKVIRPIVEGQVRSFVNDHPEVADAVSWYKPRKDKQQTLINSISKRIIRDLLCLTTRARLAAALGGMGHCRSVGAEPVTASGPAGDDVEVPAASSPTC